MAMLRNTIGLLAIFAAGAVFGPVLIAAVAALHDEAVYPEERAERLLATYDARPLGDPLPISEMAPTGDGAECGYDPAQLFSDDEVDPRTQASLLGEKRFSDYEGYIALDNWSQENKYRGRRAALANYIERKYSNFEIEFLHSCIEKTILMQACKNRVDKTVSQFDSRNIDYFLIYPAAGNETDVVCTYLDAVAARRGVSIPERD